METIGNNCDFCKINRKPQFESLLTLRKNHFTFVIKTNMVLVLIKHITKKKEKIGARCSYVWESMFMLSLDMHARTKNSSCIYLLT